MMTTCLSGNCPWTVPSPGLEARPKPLQGWAVLGGEEPNLTQPPVPNWSNENAATLEVVANPKCTPEPLPQPEPLQIKFEPIILGPPSQAPIFLRLCVLSCPTSNPVLVGPRTAFTRWGCHSPRRLFPLQSKQEGPLSPLSLAAPAPNS